MRRFNSIRNPLRSPGQDTQYTANQPQPYSPSPPPLGGGRQQQQGNTGNTGVHRTPWQASAPRCTRETPRETDNHEADDFDSGSNSSRSPSPPRQRGAPRQNMRSFGDGSVPPRSPSPLGRRQVSRRNTEVSGAGSMSSRSSSPQRGNPGARRDRNPRNTRGDNNDGVDDDDDGEAEMLRKAMAESINFHEHERDVAESRRHIQETVEAAYRESEADAARRRVQDAERDEEQREMERQALEESRRTEEERVQRRRDQLTRMDRQFGSGPGSAARVGEGLREQGGRARGRAADSNNADVPVSPSARGNNSPYPEESGRRPRQQHRREPATTHRDQQPAPGGGQSAARDHPHRERERQRQQQHQPEPSPALGRGPHGGPPTHPAFSPGPPTMEQSGPPPSFGQQQPNYIGRVVPPQSLPFAGMAIPRAGGPGPGPGHPRARSPSPRPTNPIDYSIEDVMALSLRDSDSNSDSDDSNHEALQAAINESAEQHRDEEQEAIQRNVGTPSYQEACAAPRVRAPRGARYRFQGPNKAVLDGDGGGEGSSGGGDGGGGKKPARELEIVGDMDLNEAMRIANAGSSKQTGGKNKKSARR